MHGSRRRRTLRLRRLPRRALVPGLQRAGMVDESYTILAAGLGDTARSAMSGRWSVSPTTSGSSTPGRRRSADAADRIRTRVPNGMTTFIRQRRPRSAGGSQPPRMFRSCQMQRMRSAVSGRRMGRAQREGDGARKGSWPLSTEPVQAFWRRHLRTPGPSATILSRGPFTGPFHGALSRGPFTGPF